MLVLSRRVNQKVILPSVPATIQVVSVKAGVVRLGIDAPPEVPVYREEIAPEAPAEPRAASEARHALRNRLNAATLGLAMLRHQVRAGLTEDSDRTLDRLDEEVRRIRRQVELAARPVAPPRPPVARKALVVEDDRNQRELLAGLLRMAGLDVVTAGDGSDALDYLRGRGPADVVLLDMVLPRLDGTAVIREIRRDPACGGVKIFALSGHARETFDVATGPAGIDRWFAKPLDPEALLRDLCQELGVPS